MDAIVTIQATDVVAARLSDDDRRLYQAGLIDLSGNMTEAGVGVIKVTEFKPLLLSALDEIANVNKEQE